MKKKNQRLIINFRRSNTKIKEVKVKKKRKEKKTLSSKPEVGWRQT